MSIKNPVYAAIRSQIKYDTGSFPITCPECQKPARAVVSKIFKSGVFGRPNYRNVRTVCRHCKTSYTFAFTASD